MQESAQFRHASVTDRAQAVRSARLPSPGWWVGGGLPFPEAGARAARRGAVAASPERLGLFVCRGACRNHKVGCPKVGCPGQAPLRETDVWSQPLQESERGLSLLAFPIRDIGRAPGCQRPETLRPSPVGSPGHQRVTDGGEPGRFRRSLIRRLRTPREYGELRCFSTIGLGASRRPAHALCARSAAGPALSRSALSRAPRASVRSRGPPAADMQPWPPHRESGGPDTALRGPTATGSRPRARMEPAPAPAARLRRSGFDS